MPRGVSKGPSSRVTHYIRWPPALAQVRKLYTHSQYTLPLRPLKTMANRKACSTLIVALVVFTGLRHAFVPAPARSAAPMAAAGGMLSVLGAQAAHADKIDDAAAKLSEASYPFLKEID